MIRQLHQPSIFVLLLVVVFLSCAPETDAQDIVLSRSGATCADDPNCINRLHPTIPMVARAESGEQIVFQSRSTVALEGPPGSTVHSLSGPVHIVGTRAGDTIAVTVVSVEPFSGGITRITGNGLLADQFADQVGRIISWELGPDYATSPDIPNVRIPKRGFPGVITSLPGPGQITTYLARELAAARLGGRVQLPEPINAVPVDICGPDSPIREECVRTGPPREHGGNMDIRYHSAGTTIYLPCYIDGCGLAIGDVHYAQGDGEVAGTAIEMAADVTVRVEVLAQTMSLTRGPHYEEDGEVLAPSTGRFYATTGLPFKEAGDLPSHLRYLQSPVAEELSYLSDDLFLAARNALMEMLDYLIEQHGLTREQAYFLSSVAVDLRIGQLVDAGHINVTAVLPLDVFVE